MVDMNQWGIMLWVMGGTMRKEVIGNATLYLGDCREVKLENGSVDAVITDPPYGDQATHAGHLSCVVLRDGAPAGRSLGFSGITESDAVEMASGWVDLARSWVVFTSEWKFLNALDEAGLLVRFGIWRKPDGAPQFTGDRPGMGWEAVAVCHRKGKKKWNGGGKHAFWCYPKGGGRSSHPTEKPVALFTDFVCDFTCPGDVVFDPFMGSGTTGVAAIKEGRRFVGIEREQQYFDIACKRVEQQVLENTTRLFV